MPLPENRLDRRAFLRLSGLAALAPGLPSSLVPGAASAGAAAMGIKADHTLRIARSRIELARGRIVSTLTYNGQFPGPLLRLTTGARVVVDIRNETDTADEVYWHGQRRPNDAGTAAPARALRRIAFTPDSPGLSFYHSSLIAGANLEAGLYSGQWGPVLVESRGDPGRFDREVVLVLKEFEPQLRRTPQGFVVGYGVSSINGRMLGHGEPVRVRAGERVLFHFANASATRTRELALPAHTFTVIALDGNPVPVPAEVPVVKIGPSERVSALVRMSEPGVWILGALADDDRNNGMGIVVEYAGRSGKPVWSRPAAYIADYARFGQRVGQRIDQGTDPETDPGTPARVDETLELTFARAEAARSGFSQWTVNDRVFSTERPEPLFRLRHGRRYRLRLRNTNNDVYALHLRRHRFEITGISGRATAGVTKDVVTLGGHQRMELDFVADSPGPALLHCTRQLHRDFGLMALIDYG